MPCFVEPRFLFSFSAFKAHLNFAPSAATLQRFRKEIGDEYEFVVQPRIAEPARRRVKVRAPPRRSSGCNRADYQSEPTSAPIAPQTPPTTAPAAAPPGPRRSPTSAPVAAPVAAPIA